MAGSGHRTAQLRWEMVSGLRRWAEGSLTDQAAVELLASWSAGCLIRPDATWVQPCRAAGFFSLDGDALAAHAATRTGDEERVLRLAAALVNGDLAAPPAGQPGAGRLMNVADCLNPGWLAHLVGALVVSVAFGVAVLVAIGTAEVRSRRGEAERVAAIRQALLDERQPAGQGDRSRS